MTISKIISSLQRTQRKRRVIRTILSSPQFNNTVVNIHRLDPANTGDYYSAPHHYFQELKNTSLDIFDFKRENKEVTENFINKICDSSLIIGGGGLLNNKGFKRQMRLFENLSENNKKVVLWGIGHNKKYGEVKDYSVNISKFGLVGTRDFSMPGQWVPCVSCLHPLFDEQYTEKRKLGIVFHKDTLKKPAILDRFKEIPSTSNDTDLLSLINFIGSSESIITDSYHAMYWSILLDKKVVVVPNSSKFFDFKYQTKISSFENSIKNVKKAPRYTGVLEECREINIKFAETVFDFLKM